MSKKRLKIAIDMDWVIADLMTKWINVYNEQYDDNLKVTDIKDWDVTLFVKPECGSKMLDIPKIKNFYLDLEVVKDSIEVTKKLSERFDLYIATDAMSTPSSMKAKYLWLQKNFPHIPDRNYIFCGDKSIVKTDFLIDDALHNLEKFSGDGILFNASWNQNNNNFIRVYSWKDIEKYFDNL